MDFGIPQKCQMCSETKPLWLFHNRLWCKGCIRHFYYVLRQALEQEANDDGS